MLLKHSTSFEMKDVAKFLESIKSLRKMNKAVNQFILTNTVEN